MSSPVLDNLPAALSGHVGYLLVRLGKHAQRLFSLKVEPLGVRPAHCDILLTLVARGALAQVDIASTLSIERAHLVALLDQLESMGFLIREPDAVDRRRHAVRLTAKGMQVATKISRLALEVEDSLVEPLAKKERELLRKMLRLLAQDADEGD